MSLPDGNNGACGLLKVPPEILDRITWHLTTTEYCNLRLTSKAIEQAVFFKFTSEFFTRKQFMVSEFSLKALRDISKSRLAEYLRQVHLGLDQLDPLSVFAANGSSETLEAMRMLQLRLVEEETLWTLGLVPKYLAEAFARLPNLETCVIRDFNSARRSRDGPLCHWTSYGNRTLFRETMTRPRPRQTHNWSTSGYSEYASRMFKAVVHALAMAEARPTAIEVMERHGHLLFDSAFFSHPDFESAVAAVLGRLKRLHLCLDMAWSPLYRTNEVSQIYLHANLAKLLRHCEDLEELRINGKRDYISASGGTTLYHLFDWLATKSFTERPPPSLPDGEPGPPISPPAELARLKTLSLGMTVFTVEDLVPLIARFADTLENLELWRIHLSSREKVNDGETEEDGPVLFTQLLRKLLDTPNLNLRHIKLGNLHQTLRPNGRAVLTQAVEFKPETKTRDQDVVDGLAVTSTALAYTGSDWRHFVSHEMIPRLYAPRLRDTEMDVEVEDGEDGEDDDVHDDDDNSDSG